MLIRFHRLLCISSNCKTGDVSWISGGRRAGGNNKWSLMNSSATLILQWWITPAGERRRWASCTDTRTHSVDHGVGHVWPETQATNRQTHWLNGFWRQSLGRAERRTDRAGCYGEKRRLHSLSAWSCTHWKLKKIKQRKWKIFDLYLIFLMWKEKQLDKVKSGNVWQHEPERFWKKANVKRGIRTG